MGTKTKQISPMLRAASINTPTEKDGERLFDVVFATEKPVLMSPWWSDSSFYEVLDMKGMRSERMDNGAPFLDNHDVYSSVQKNVLGTVVKHWMEGVERKATIKLSNRAELDSLWMDIKDGVQRNISCRYKVFAYKEIPMVEGQTIPTYIATDWEVSEVSLVTIPADPTAGVRSENKDLNTVSIMSDKNKPVDPTAIVTEPAHVNLEAERAQAAKEERGRVNEIHALQRRMNLPDEFVSESIDKGTSIDEFRKLAIDKYVSADPAKGVNASEAKVGADSKDKLRAAMIDGLAFRSGSKVEKGAAGFEDFRGMPLIRMAEEFLISNGVSTRGMTQREIATQALGLAGSRAYHSSSDFPNILASTVNRRLQAAYAEQSRTFQSWTRRGTAQDFRLMSVVALSGIIGSFDAIPEGGEYKAKTMSDSKEEYKVTKFGMKIGITWESLINDDLSAFNRLPQAIAAKAAQKQSDIVYGIVTDNANMSDANALFSVAHANLAGTATGITAPGLKAADIAFLTQTAANGDKINVTPRYLICGPAKKFEALQILNGSIVASTTGDVNLFKGYADLIVEPRLTGNQWYLAASPSMIDTIEYSFLQGEEDLFTEQRVGFDVDGLEIKARMVFGAKAIDWRGMYKNAGA